MALEIPASSTSASTSGEDPNFPPKVYIADLLDDTSSNTLSAEELEETPVPKKKKDTRKGRRGGKKKKKKHVSFTEITKSAATSPPPGSTQNPNIENIVFGSFSGPAGARPLPEPPLANPTYVKVKPYWEVRFIDPDQGSVGTKGVFSTRYISKGTRVICEEPLMCIPRENRSIEAVMDAYEKLPKSQRARIWSIMPLGMHIPQLEQLSTCITPMAKVLDDIGKKPEAAWTESEKLCFANTGINVAKLCKMYRIVARFFSHRQAVIEATPTERRRMPEDKTVSGLFVQMAQLRHSCVPNCTAQFNYVTGMMTIHATKDIQFGEELTLSAIGNHVYYNTIFKRSAELEECGIVCDCEACDKTHPKFRNHDDLRAKLHTNSIHSTNFLKYLDYIDPDYPELAGIIEDEENIVLEIINDLKEVGCADMDLVRWRRVLTNSFHIHPAMKLRHQATLAHACANVIIATRCYGEDHPNLLEYKQRQEMIEMAMAKERLNVNRDAYMREKAKQMEELFKIAGQKRKEKAAEAGKEKTEEGEQQKVVVKCEGKGKAKVEDDVEELTDKFEVFGFGSDAKQRKTHFDQHL